MLTIELSELRKEASALSQFLLSKVKGPIRIHGSQLELRDAKHREIKLLLHKFLHHKGFENYRVVSTRTDFLEFVPLKPKVHERPQREGTPPSASVTMPYFFPSYGKGSIPVPAGRKRGKKP